jgi:uncharacterized LabA/DUF88 family protein
MRVAVFVDAGYVYTQGSCTLTGLKTPKRREQVTLDESKITELLKKEAKTSADGKELLRIYWYDGAPSSGPSVGQARIGNLNDVKLRLGQLNSEGEQKGVDSLIVTDLIELARNRAIGNALVLTGDEDIRVGVQIAQSLGVRVHLLGFSGPKGSQSQTLQQEADTRIVWDKAQVAYFLSIPSEQIKTAAKKAIVKLPPQSQANQNLSSNDDDAINIAVTMTLVLLRKEPIKLSSAVKNAKAGKDLPGHTVSELKKELQKSIGSKPTKNQNKLARDKLGEKLRDEN